jgi:hypothetical protein
VNSEKTIERKFRQLKDTMNERMTRLWAGAEAEAQGHGGIAMVARATGLAISTERSVGTRSELARALRGW